MQEGASTEIDFDNAVASSQGEWRRHWRLVAASAVGFSIQTVPTYTLGIMMVPLGREFGWGRAQISMASLIPAVAMVLSSPFVGAIVDRWGSRRLALPSLALTGLSIAAIALANGSAWQWMLLWLIYAVVSLGTKATVWTAAISQAFTSSRGFALGVTLTGAGATQIIVPPLAQWLLDAFSWKVAYLVLGACWGTVAFMTAFFWLKDAVPLTRPLTPNRPEQGRAKDHPKAHLPGLSVQQAVRSVALWRIALATLLTMFIGTAVLIHQVPILVASGIDQQQAALLASLSGIAAVAGKLLSGWMVDRWSASAVGPITLLVPALAYTMLLNNNASWGATLIAMIIIGYTTGAKFQISAFLTGQYGGMRNFGKVFGVMTSMIGIGGGLGSVVAGAVYDRLGSYDAILISGIVLSFLSSALVFKLGKPEIAA